MEEMVKVEFANGTLVLDYGEPSKRVEDGTLYYKGVEFSEFEDGYKDLMGSIRYATEKKGFVKDHIKMYLHAWGDMLDDLVDNRGTHTYTDKNGVAHTEPVWSMDFFVADLNMSSLDDAETFASSIIDALDGYNGKRVEKIRFVYEDCMGAECFAKLEDYDKGEVYLGVYVANADESQKIYGLEYS